ncbi:MAG TPA: MFS transporter [Candidatus Paceibacterota bacterium]
MRTTVWYTLGYFKQRARSTFSSLSIRNYRLYFIGQGISISGTWMQTVAQGWLVLQLTGSGTQVGFVVALQFLPLLFITPFGGMIADSFPKRRTLFITQGFFILQQLTLGIIVLTGVVEMWMIYYLALTFGLINAVDNPTRQAFVSELVDRDHVRNAIALNATENNLARAVGPSIGAILIAGIGIGFCFIANAFSTLAVITALFMLDTKRLQPHASPVRLHPLKQLSEAWRYVKKTPLIRNTLIMAVVIGTFAYEFQITLPILAKFAFGTDAAAYSRLWVAFGLGSVVGGLVAAGRKRVAPHTLVGAAILFGFSMLLVSLMPTLDWAVAGMLLVGFFSINFTSLANTSLQLKAEPAMRGRVMSLWTMAMLGSTPIGGPIVGAVAEHFGARWGIALGGLAALVAGAFAARTLLKNDRSEVVPESIRTADLEAEGREEAKFK